MRALFGSVARDNPGPESKVDALLGLDPRARKILFEIARMRDELSQTPTTSWDLRADRVYRHESGG